MLGPGWPAQAVWQEYKVTSKGPAMLKYVKSFAAREHGAVTIDWAVLSAWIVIMASAAILIVQLSVSSFGEAIAAEVSVQNGN